MNGLNTIPVFTSLLPQKLNRKKIYKMAMSNIESLKSPDGWLYASLGRYECFFGRDAIISSLQLLDIDSTIARSTLLHLRLTQGRSLNARREEEVGKIIHEERFVKDASYLELLDEGFDFPYYGSVDGTLLYLYLLIKYFEKTKDLVFLSTFTESILLALNWVKSKQDEKYFVRVPSLNNEGKVAIKMINKNWIDSPKSLSYKDGRLPQDDASNYPVAHLEVQALLYSVSIELHKLKAIIDIDNTYIEYFESNAGKLLENILKFFSIEDGYFAPAIDAKYRKFDIVTSVPGYLLYLNILSEDIAGKVINRLMKDDLRTPYGIRVLSKNEVRFDELSYQQGAIWPHDNYIIYIGLLNYGYVDEALRLKESLIDAILTLGHIPELFNVSSENLLIRNNESTHVQAWSCGAIIAMLNDEVYEVEAHEIQKNA